MSAESSGNSEVISKEDVAKLAILYRQYFRRQQAIDQATENLEAAKTAQRATATEIERILTVTANVAREKREDPK